MNDGPNGAADVGGDPGASAQGPGGDVGSVAADANNARLEAAPEPPKEPATAQSLVSATVIAWTHLGDVLEDMTTGLELDSPTAIARRQAARSCREVARQTAELNKVD